jgi:hypothetical protein
MNLTEIHQQGRELSAKPITTSLQGRVTSIQLLKNGLMKEHLTKDPALLICVLGEVFYEDENGKKVTLLPVDFHDIESMLKHRVSGVVDSQLLLIK